MKVKHLRGFNIWVKKVVEEFPQYNEVKYLKVILKTYTRKFR